MPNKALSGIAPIMLCETEIGAKHVRRILQTLSGVVQLDRLYAAFFSISIGGVLLATRGWG